MVITIPESSFYRLKISYKGSKHMKKDNLWIKVLYFLFWSIKFAIPIQFFLVFSYSLTYDDWRVKNLHWSVGPIYLWDFGFYFKFVSIITFKLFNFFGHCPMKPLKSRFGQRNGPNLNLHYWNLFQIGMEKFKVIYFHIFKVLE